MRCPSCGKENPRDRSHCDDCGFELGGATVAGPATPRALLEQATVPASAAMTQAPTAGRPRAPSLADELAPGDRIGERYEILSILGTGGFGSVYKAQDQMLGRTVALKVIHPGLAAHPEMIERFKREILLSSKITHPNVVRIHDLGEAGDLRFISMAYIEGTDLKSLIQRDGPMDVTRALELARQIAEALQAAHRAGVIHRDLKPQNILVDGDGKAYVADFGISRSVESGQTMTEAGSVLGTLAYMSPEQARGEVADERSDIYSFGLILHEMLTGSIPFSTADTPLSQLMKRVQQDVPSIETTRAGLPPWIVKLVARTLARDLADRYPSFGELLSDLDSRRASLTVRRRVRVRLLQGGALLLAVAALVTAGLLWLPRAGRSAAETVAIPVQAELVLLPFRNVSGTADDAWTANGLPRLLRFDLEQSKSLRVVEEERVQQIVDGLKLTSGGELNEAALKRIASVLRVDNLLIGDLYRTGADAFRIQARLHRPGGSQNSFEFEASGEQALFEIVAQLAGEVRASLGISRSRGGRSAGELSTSSTEALRHYNGAIDLIRSGSDVNAAASLERVLEIDPDFAIARAELAEVLDRLGRSADALVQANRAAEDLRGLSDYEYARIRAVQAVLAGDDAAADTAYRELTRLAPNRPSVHLAHALFLEDRGEHESALAAVDRALELDPRNANLKYVRGRLLAKLSRPDESLTEFNDALALHEQLANEEGQATVLNGLGNVYGSQGKSEQALEAYRRCLAVRERLGDVRGAGGALHNIALTERDLGRFDEAVATQERALALLTELGNPEELARAYAGLGDIHSRAGNTELALAAYNKNLDLLRDSGDEASIAQAMANLGFVKMVAGAYTEAYFFQKDALEKRRAAGDPSGLMSSLSDIGAVEQVQGRFEAAIGHYAEGMELARKNGNQFGTTIFSMNLTEIYLAQGQLAAAIASLDEAEASAREMAVEDFVGTCLDARAEWSMQIGDLDAAERVLAEGFEIASRLALDALDARLRVSATELALLRGEREAARTAAARAFAGSSRAGEHRLTLMGRLAQAKADGSAAALGEVAREAERSGLAPIAARARLAQARSLGTAADALELASGAATAAEALGMRALQFESRALLSRLEQQSGRGDLGLVSAIAALDALEAMLTGLAPQAARGLRARPDVAEFARAAEPIIAAAADEQAASRLRQLMPEAESTPK